MSDPWPGPAADSSSYDDDSIVSPLDIGYPTRQAAGNVPAGTVASRISQIENYGGTPNSLDGHNSKHPPPEQIQGGFGRRPEQRFARPAAWTSQSSNQEAQQPSLALYGIRARPNHKHGTTREFTTSRHLNGPYAQSQPSGPRSRAQYDAAKSIRFPTKVQSFKELNELHNTSERKLPKASRSSTLLSASVPPSSPVGYLLDYGLCAAARKQHASKQQPLLLTDGQCQSKSRDREKDYTESTDIIWKQSVRDLFHEHGVARPSGLASADSDRTIQDAPEEAPCHMCLSAGQLKNGCSICGQVCFKSCKERMTPLVSDDSLSEVSTAKPTKHITSEMVISTSARDEVCERAPTIGIHVTTRTLPTEQNCVPETPRKGDRSLSTKSRVGIPRATKESKASLYDQLDNFRASPCNEPAKTALCEGSRSIPACQVPHLQGQSNLCRTYQNCERKPATKATEQHVRRSHSTFANQKLRESPEQQDECYHGDVHLFVSSRINEFFLDRKQRRGHRPLPLNLSYAKRQSEGSSDHEDDTSHFDRTQDILFDRSPYLSADTHDQLQMQNFRPTDSDAGRNERPLESHNLRNDRLDRSRRTTKQQKNLHDGRQVEPCQIEKLTLSTAPNPACSKVQVRSVEGHNFLADEQFEQQDALDKLSLVNNTSCVTVEPSFKQQRLRPQGETASGQDSACGQEEVEEHQRESGNRIMTRLSNRRQPRKASKEQIPVVTSAGDRTVYCQAKKSFTTPRKYSEGPGQKPAISSSLGDSFPASRPSKSKDEVADESSQDVTINSGAQKPPSLGRRVSSFFKAGKNATPSATKQLQGDRERLHQPEDAREAAETTQRLADDEKAVRYHQRKKMQWRMKPKGPKFSRNSAVIDQQQQKNETAGTSRRATSSDVHSPKPLADPFSDAVENDNIQPSEEKAQPSNSVKNEGGDYIKRTAKHECSWKDMMEKGESRACTSASTWKINPQGIVGVDIVIHLSDQEDLVLKAYLDHNNGKKCRDWAEG